MGELVPAAFAARKRIVLAALAAPAAEYQDRSPKGSVDAEIVELIHLLNGLDGIVTTSSCAGRVSLFAEGRGKQPAATAAAGESERGLDSEMDSSTLAPDGGSGAGRTARAEAAAARAQTSAATQELLAGATAANAASKGLGGRWLFVTHDPADLDQLPACIANLKARLGTVAPEDGLSATRSTHLAPSGTGNGAAAGPAASTITSGKPCLAPGPSLALSSKPQIAGADVDLSEHHGSAAGAAGAAESGLGAQALIRLQFEPMILHIQAASLAHARPILSAAMGAGWRESGVSGLRCLEAPRTAFPMVAVRSAGLALGTVVGSWRGAAGAAGPEVRLFAEPAYLHFLCSVFNERFRANRERILRFEHEVRRILMPVERSLRVSGAHGQAGAAAAAASYRKQARTPLDDADADPAALDSGVLGFPAPASSKAGRAKRPPGRARLDEAKADDHEREELESDLYASLKSLEFATSETT